MSDPHVSDRLEPGAMIAAKYRVVRVLGEGGMGIVYEAEHVALRERVAIKLLHKKRATDGEIARRFQSEARTAVRIKSDAVARVLDVGQTEDGSPFMVMEKLDGEDLGALIDRDGALTVDQAVDFLLQASEAVAAAHAVGIIHRDLKPSNLFVAQDSAGELHIKVLDFGISKVFEESPDSQRAVTSTSAVLGSPGYMSPEQMRASRDVDARSDVWALGMILWEAIAGVPMYAGRTYPEICAKVLGGHFLPLSAAGVTAPPALDAAVMRALALEPDARFSSVSELAAAIAPFGPPGSEARVQRIGNLARAPSDRQRRTPSLRPPVELSPTEPALPSTTDRVSSRNATDSALASDSERTPTVSRRTAVVSVVAVAAVGLAVVLLLQSGRTDGPGVPSASPLPSVAAPSASPPAPSASPATSSAELPAAPAPSHAPSADRPTPPPTTSARPTPTTSASAAPSASIKPSNGAPILH